MTSEESKVSKDGAGAQKIHPGRKYAATLLEGRCWQVREVWEFSVPTVSSEGSQRCLPNGMEEKGLYHLIL